MSSHPTSPAGVWIPCGTCWGQRRLYAAPFRGAPLTAQTCPSCMGLGERLSEGGASPAAGG